MASDSKAYNYTHLFHPYPAKFPPGIIGDYINTYSKKGDTVLDPFCGSGTTLVESILHGRNAIGIELNPVGALISKSKATFYSEKELEYIHKYINIIKGNIFNNVENILPNYPNRSHWFKDNVIKELNTIKYYIEKEKYNVKIYNLLLTAFSKIIVNVSNQDNETRYARVEKNIKEGDTINLYVNTLKYYVKALKDYTNVESNSKAEIIEGDTLILLEKMKKESVDLVITSPPYINSFDYYLYHKHRIYLIGKEPLYIRKREIGGHHTIDTQSFEKAYNNYYQAMNYLFQNIYKILKKQKYFIMLIGDGIVKGKVINVDNVIIEIANKNSFTILEINTMPLVNVSKTFIKGEKIHKKKHHVIIFKKR